jgi:hypothetical protein
MKARHPTLLSLAIALLGCSRMATPDPVNLEPVTPEPESPPRPPPLLSGLVVGWQGGCVKADGEEVWCWGADVIEPSEDRPPHEPALVGDQNVEISLRETCKVADGDITCHKHFSWPYELRDIPDIRQHLDVEVDTMGGCGVWPNGLVRYWAYEVSTQGVIEGAIDAELHDHGCCVRTESGRVACLGGELLGKHFVLEDPSLQLVPGIDEITELELGLTHGCMLDRAGRVRCFGNNRWGQLGTGDGQPHEGLVEVPLPGPATELAAAHGQTCVIAAGQLLCWGAYEFHRGRPHFGRVEFEFDAVALHAEVNASCATKPDGSLWCWGIPSPVPHIGWHEAVRGATPSEVPSPWPITQFNTAGIRSGDDFILLKDNPRSSWPLALHEDDLLVRIPGVAGFTVNAGEPCVFGGAAGFRCFARIYQYDDYAPRNHIPEIRNVTALAMFEDTMCAVHGGQVSCLNDHERRWVQIPEIANIRSVVDDGGGRWCALAADGRISCWRSDEKPSLRYVVHEGPYVLGERDVVEIAWGWGLLARTKSGALRSGPAIEADEQLETVIEAGVLEVLGNPKYGGHACARVDRDGDGQSERIVCLGDDRVGQLGRLGEHVSLAPRRIAVRQ